MLKIPSQGAWVANVVHFYYNKNHREFRYLSLGLGGRTPRLPGEQLPWRGREPSQELAGCVYLPPNVALRSQ